MSVTVTECLTSDGQVAEQHVCALQDVPELSIFKAVAAWCQLGSAVPRTQLSSCLICSLQADASNSHCQQAYRSTDTCHQLQQQSLDRQSPAVLGDLARASSDVADLLQLVRFAFMTDADRQVGSLLSFLQCSLQAQHVFTVSSGTACIQISRYACTCALPHLTSTV